MAIKVVVAITGSELARFAIFYGSLFNIITPPETIVRQSRGASVAENRNELAKYALEVGAEYIFYVDDDQIIPSDTLTKLLSHQKDIVSGLYLHRNPPFAPLIFGREDEKGLVYHRLLRTGESGLIPVVCSGAGCLLINMKVFEKMEKPWWTLGQIEKDKWCDDVDFCRRARAAGFDLYCDLNAPVGHVMISQVWPTLNNDGKWVTTIMQDHVLIDQFPAAYLATDPQIINPRDIA